LLGRRDAVEVAAVGLGQGVGERDVLVVSHQGGGFDLRIRKNRGEGAKEVAEPVTAGSLSWSRVMIHTIRDEQRVDECVDVTGVEVLGGLLLGSDVRDSCHEPGVTPVTLGANGPVVVFTLITFATNS
jgi:hypothetical protein